MHCPFCRNPDSRVVDSRTTDDGTSIRRRRQCKSCGLRFSSSLVGAIVVFAARQARAPARVSRPLARPLARRLAGVESRSSR